MELMFEIPGEPRGKGRPRFSRRGNYIRTYTPASTASYENLVVVECERQCPQKKFAEDAQIKAEIDAYYDIPKSASKKKRAEMTAGTIRPTKKPDCDNIIKIILDALNDVAYKDDAQIVECVVRKYYAEEPKVIVILQEAGSGENG